MIKSLVYTHEYPLKKSLKHLLLSVIALVISQIAGKAQDKILQNIFQQYDQGETPNLYEKVFVHTDKTVYLAGELMWFKLYLVDGYLNKPIDISKVTYVEILSSDKKPVLQAKIAMESGKGNGSFLIPPSLNSGNYFLRAYTNWMKNFLADSYFEKQVTIINSLKRPDWKTTTTPRYDVQFFPEGGNLVEGVNSKVAFRITDQNGRGVDCSGAVVNQNNDTVAIIKTARFGIGSFVFLPKQKNVYKATISINDSFLVKELPTVYNNGYVMSLVSLENNQLKITVNTNNISSNLPVYLLIHKRQLVKTALMQRLQNGTAIFLVDKKECSEGISYFTLFDGSGQPVCERLYFKLPQKKLTINIKPDHQEYGTKKRVTIDLSTFSDTSHPLPANMSVSVFLVDSLQRLEHNDIFSYLWLGSDLKGKIDSPEYYYTNTGKEVDEAIDNLMLTHGWRKFNWNDSLTIKKPFLRFLPEYEGHIISGTLINKKNGTPKSGTTAFLSIPGERFQFNNSISDEMGHLSFIVKEFLGTEEIIVQTDNKKDSGLRIDISNAFSEDISTTAITPFDLSEKWKNLVVSRSIGTQAQNLYLADSIRRFLAPRFGDTTLFYGKPDKQYFLDDYTRFITMEEVMREFVTEVRVRKHQDSFYFQVMNDPYKKFFEDDPLLLLDGVPLFDASKIISFDPLKIKKIEVVTQRYYYGPMVYYGVVNYQTYQGDLAGFQLDPASLVVEYEGLQLKREFYSPVYNNDDKQPNRLPDFRNVLYWAPDVITNEKGGAQFSFYTSELPGTYAVILYGITANGFAGSSTATFSVVNQAKP